MSKNDKYKWEQKYSGDDYEPDRDPSALLTEWQGDRPPGSALDLACGTGRNALYLLESESDRLPLTRASGKILI